MSRTSGCGEVCGVSGDVWRDGGGMEEGDKDGTATVGGPGKGVSGRVLE